jgi:alkanesulfonate monooxygenase SsuD/methylene tetrahydromethanopterin reductase-like flavin-dependent oxidoreductase (luciferase family)
MQSAYGLPAERAQELAIVGTPEQVADQVARYLEFGAERVAVISDLTPMVGVVARGGRGPAPSQ